MLGDFSTRFFFRKIKHYIRVLLQQGRVTLDADYEHTEEGKSRRRVRRKER